MMPDLTTPPLLPDKASGQTLAATEINDLRDAVLALYQALGAIDDGNEATLAAVLTSVISDVIAIGGLAGAAQDAADAAQAAADAAQGTADAAQAAAATAQGTADTNTAAIEAVEGLPDYSGSSLGDVLSITAGGPAWVAVEGLGSGGGGGGTGYAAEVQADAPVVYWQMSDTSDSSGNGRTASFEAGAVITTGGAGVVGEAVDLLSANALVQDPVSPIADYNTAGPWTMECWTKHTGTDRKCLMHTGGRIDNGIEVDVEGTAVKVLVNQTDRTIGSAAALNDGAWHHVVVTYSAANGFRAYVDGTLIGTVAATTGAVAASRVLRVGLSNGGLRDHGGMMDEVAFYQSELTLERVQAHYTAAP